MSDDEDQHHLNPGEEGSNEPSSFSSEDANPTDLDELVPETVANVAIDEDDLDLRAGDLRTVDDDARMILLWASLIIFGVTILLGIMTSWKAGPAKWEQTEAFIHALLPVESLLLGGAVTYWFKTRP